METKKGEWYFGLNCSRCNTRIALFHDKSKGTAKLDFIGRSQSEMVANCPKCGERIEYVPEMLDSQEAQ